MSARTGHRLKARLRLTLLGAGILISGTYLLRNGTLRGAEQRNPAYSQGTVANSSIRIMRDGSNRVVEGVVIVKLKEPQVIPRGLAKTGVSSLDKLLGEQGVYSIEQAYPLPAQLLGQKSAELRRIYTMRFDTGASPRQVALRISQDPNVEYALPQYAYRVNDSADTRSTSISSLLAATPDDPLYTLMSHLGQIQAPAAWDVVKGEDGAVIVAVVDGGTDWLHEDLLANVWTNPAESNNGNDDDGNGYIDDVNGWNFVNNNGNPAGLPGTPFNENHGTQVAGVASAVTNNTIGIAGASWNAQLLLVNASCPSDSFICFGVEGIVYAAVNGADVINLSWGSAHRDVSSFEERALFQFWGDVADFAAERGALLVAAAGNDSENNDTVLHMPASAEHILAVGATLKSFDGKTGFSNYGVTVDVFAPGAALNSTIPGDAYSVFASGTSFAAPLVTGIAALVKTQYPDLAPWQLGQQVRVTANSIDQFNTSGLRGLLGKGRINAYRAVTENSTPAIRIAGTSFTDSGGDGFIQNGETVNVTVSLINYLADATNISITLTQKDPIIAVTSADAFISSLVAGETKDVTFQFTLGQADLGQPLPFIVEISAGSYQDRDLFKLYANEPAVVTHDTGPVQVSLTTEGNIGWAGFADLSVGAGFVYNQTNLLFEGGLLVGISADKVSDCIRDIDGALEQDFQMPPGAQMVLGPGQIANEEGTVLLIDDLASSPLGLLIRQESYADNNPDYDDFVIFKYTITNTSGQALWNLYAGLFFDWDLSENGQADFGRFDEARRMGSVQNGAASPTILAATRMLTESGELSYRTISNPDEIYDDFTPTEKWQYLSGGIQTRDVDNTDVSTLMAAGPFAMQPGQSIEVAFAVIAASTRADLDIHSDSAQAFWDRAIRQQQPNHAPVFTSVLPATTITAGETLTYTYRAEDVDGDDLTLTLIEGPPTAAIDGATGELTFQSAIDQVGTHKITVFVSDSHSSTLSSANVTVEEALFSLSQNYSNPFRLSATTPTTTIEYQLPIEGKIEIVVYDLLGREVRTLVSDTRPPGKYSVTWDARDNNGRPLSTGIYLYRIRAGDFIKIRKMMLLK